MGDRDSSSSSDSPDTSPSEGEYEIEDDSSSTQDDSMPKFDFGEWNPEAPAGLQFLSLLPLSVGFGYNIDYEQQHDHVGKIKPSTLHRRARRTVFSSGKTIARDILDEKRLRTAANNDDYFNVLELLDSGVSACGADEKKRTALHFAAARGYDNIVSLLLDRGADPNQKDIIGNTPLHLAACTNHISVVTLLLRAGTSISSFDNSGRTPLHLAMSRLKILSDDKAQNADQLKTEVSQIIDMMKEYLKVSGHGEKVTELNELCVQLRHTSTRDEVDVINELLTNFTSLSIQKKE